MRIRIINPITTQSFTRSLAAEASRNPLVWTAPRWF